MLCENLLICIGLAISLLMVFGNKKVRLSALLLNQFKVFKNAKTGRISSWDIICFIIFPIVLSLIITIEFNNMVSDILAGVLTTIFSFVFTILFGFVSILVGKLNSSNKIEKQVATETFVSIITTNILSLFSVIIAIAIIITKGRIVNMILSIFLYSFSFMILMLLMMISKRIFTIYNNISSKNM